MRVNRSIICLAALTVGCSGGRWTTRDYALQATHVVLEVVDYGQTRVATGMCLESNPIVGKCGDGPVPINIFFPLMVLANVAISNVLPTGWRSAWQGVSIGVQADVAYTNYLNGVKPW